METDHTRVETMLSSFPPGTLFDGEVVGEDRGLTGTFYPTLQVFRGNSAEEIATMVDGLKTSKVPFHSIRITKVTFTGA